MQQGASSWELPRTVLVTARWFGALRYPKTSVLLQALLLWYVGTKHNANGRKGGWYW